MATTVYKQLATKQDLALGSGKVIQLRNGISIELDEIDIRAIGDIKAIEVDTITELRTNAGNLTTRSRATVLGYYTLLDGGGGPTRIWKEGEAPGTYVDNGGGIIVPSGGDGSSAWLLSYSGPSNILWFGARDGIAYDSTDAVKATIAWESTKGTNTGGAIYAPAGQYKLIEQIVVPSGMTIFGDGSTVGTSASYQGVTSFYAVHNDPSIFSLKGTIGANLRDFTLEGDQTTHPKTGLLLGRANITSQSAFNKVDRVGVYGFYSVAAVYSIAAESNTFTDLVIHNAGGVAISKYCFYTSESDDFAVDSLFTSTNINNALIRPEMENGAGYADCAAIYMNINQSTGGWEFIGGYLTIYSGAYIEMNFGDTSGTLTPVGSYNFYGMNGERIAGGDPLFGFKLTAAAALIVRSLNIAGCRFDFQAGANHFDFSLDPLLTLENPNIIMQPPEASPYATTYLPRNQVEGGIVSVGRTTTITAALTNGWNTDWTDFNGYGTPGYFALPDGTIRLTGAVGDGALGTSCFNLPVGFRPLVQMQFTCPTVTAGGVSSAGVVIITTNGDVKPLVGYTESFILTDISFTPYSKIL